MKKILVVLLLLCSICIADDKKPTDSAANPKPKPRDILTLGITLNVNNDAIHSNQVIKPLMPKLKQIAAKTNQKQFHAQALRLVYSETMGQISEMLLYQKAKKELAKNAPIDDIIKRVRESKFKTLVRNYGGNEALARAELTKKGIDFDEVLNSAVRGALVTNYRESYFRTTKTVSRAEMAKYYQKHLKDEFTLEDKLQFQLIDIRFEKAGSKDKAFELANELMAQLNNKADFDKMVEQYSDGFRKSSKGVWPEMKLDKNGKAPGLREQYQKVIAEVNKIKVGKHTDIIETKDRFFVAKLIKKQKAGIIPFSKAQFQIKKKLYDQEWVKVRTRLQSEMENESIFGDLNSFCANTTKLAYQQIKQEEKSNAGQ